MKSRRYVIPIVLASAFLVTVLVGCATTRPAEQALVCPRCKVVTIEPSPDEFSIEEGLTRSYRASHSTIVRHSCPGCQGALTTLFTEGKLQHKCSICDQSPFSCPVSHR